jgi:GT2 family glycosyltransferase
VYGHVVSLLITVPVYGQHEYSHAVVGDLEREGAEYSIVDNRGDDPRIGNERVITPRENLGWAGERARVPSCILGGLLPRDDA